MKFIKVGSYDTVREKDDVSAEVIACTSAWSRGSARVDLRTLSREILLHIHFRPAADANPRGGRVEDISGAEVVVEV